MYLSNTANEKNGLRRDMIFRHKTLFCANLSKEYYGKFSNQTNYGTNHAKRSNHDVLPIWNQMVSQAFFFQVHENPNHWRYSWGGSQDDSGEKKALELLVKRTGNASTKEHYRFKFHFGERTNHSFMKKKKSLRDFSDTWKSLNADDKILLNTESWQWCISRDKNAAKQVCRHRHIKHQT